MYSFYPLHLPSLDRVIVGSPLTVSPNTPVMDVIRLMSQAQVRDNPSLSSDPLANVKDFGVSSQESSSCVLVVEEDRRLLGIYTERDTTRLISVGMDLSNVTIAEVMQQPVVTLNVSTSHNIFTVLSLMRQHQIRHLPVVNEHGDLAGLVTQESIRQVLEAQLVERTTELAKVNVQLIHEIGERRQAEDALQERHEQWQALFNHALDAILIADDEGRYVDANPSACLLFGVSKPDLLGKRISDFAEPGFDFAQAWQHFQQQQRVAGGFRVHRPDGTVREAEFAAVADFIPHRHLAILRDITEKKQLEEQFYRAQRLESLGTLASGIAHDLNNVFTPIIAIAHLLSFKLQETDSQIQDMLEALQDSARRGADLVQQVLMFARGTESKRIFLQAGHLLQEVTKIIRQTFPKSIEICTYIPSQTLWLVSADPTQLHQVFMNLAVNARDAMPNGGTLCLSAENRYIDATHARMNLDAHEGNYVVVTVADTGTGISPKLLDRIFDPFFTTKETGKGTGLGLSTVLGIVKNYGGFVQVSSTTGQGTQFEVYLPAVDGIALQQTNDERVPQGHGELILIADDETSIQQTTKTALEMYHYRTLIARNGLETIARYTEHRDDIRVILLDMMMPNMDGLVALRTLKKLNPQVKIIATSGLPMNRQSALSAGAHLFLAKPYATTDLLIALHSVLST